MNQQQIKDIVNDIDLGTELYSEIVWFVIEKGDGYLLQFTYLEADIDLGHRLEWQKARKWYISSHAIEGEVVRTALSAVKMSLEHRLREAFTYKGDRIFSPHIDPSALRKFVRSPGAIEERPKAPAWDEEAS